jgi:hypothetical protein
MNFQAVSVAQKDAHGGINLLPNGQEGAPSALLEAALQHTDASIGKMVAALKAAGLWGSTELVVTAKHGQDPRVGLGGLIKDNALTDVLAAANVGVAQATQDNVSLIWLKDQGQTAEAVSALEHFKATGTLKVFFQGVEQDLPASQVIDQILSGQALVGAGLGNPATDSTTPDVIITLKPGYILVGNVNNQHKRAEHGGFSPDSTHVALIVSGGALPQGVRGTTVTQHVDTRQIAVSTLEALGLDPGKLTGAVAEGTQGLPGLGLPVGHDLTLTEGKKANDVVLATFTDESAARAAKDIQITGAWGDGTTFDTDDVEIVQTGATTFEVLGSHKFKEEGTFTATLTITDKADGTSVKVADRVLVTDALLKATGDSFTAKVGAAVTTTVATFTDAGGAEKAGTYKATIQWGDGKTSTGTVQADGHGGFRVVGSHTYQAAGDFTVLVTILDEGGSTAEAKGHVVVKA